MDIQNWIYNIYNGKTDIVNYKPYSNGRVVETITIDNFIKLFQQDVIECQEFLLGFPNVNVTAEEMAKDIWRKRIIVF